MKDFEGEWGDRRQEIVFIGQQMKTGGEKRLRAALDACLLDDKEFQEWEKIMTSKNPQKGLEKRFKDGFEDWLGPEEFHAGHDHH
jgi:hypothetical protein